MKKIARHILVCWLASTMLLSSTGLSIHHIYCYCKKESSTSLFCAEAEQKQAEMACCQGEKCGSPCASSDPHNCADCSTEYVKLDADYLLFPTDFKLNFPVVFAQTHFFKTRLPQANVKLMLAEPENAPPPPFGKELLPLIQSFLC